LQLQKAFQMPELQKIRIDKWLWAVRLFKTRTLATEACNAGKVKIDNMSVKPAYLVKPGQVIHSSNQGHKKVVKVLRLIEKRAGAEIAQACYEDLTPPELTEKAGPAFFYTFEVRDKGAGRPTKRQRRDIDRFKGN
jgi:ribosome-associated heat shock protein Hsp15